MLKGSADGLFETVVVFPHPYAVHNQLNIVGLIAVQLHIVGQLADFTIDPYTQEPFLCHLGEKFAIMALARLYQRGKDDNVLAVVVLVDKLQDVLLGVFHHALAAHMRVGDSHAGIKQADKIVYLGHRAHGRAWVLVGGLLLDGDDWTESVDAVHIGSFNIADKAPCIGRECFHIAALPFGMYGVESQARLAAAAEAGEDNKLVARNIDIDILQVMLTGA